MIITQHSIPAEYAPTIFFNHCGRMPWSGRSQSDFSGAMVVELLKFCEEEGGRQGRNDANQDHVGARAQAPFHEAFLGGYPKQLWESAYWEGVSEPRQFLQLVALDADDVDALEAVHSKFETDQQLIDALPKDGEFGLSWVQRMTRWGYNRAGEKLKQFVRQGLLIQVEGKPNRYVMAPTRNLGDDHGAI